MYVRYKNTGTTTWNNTGGVSNPNFMELRSVDGGCAIINGAMYDGTWINRQRIHPFDTSGGASIPPGATAKFSFTGVAPSTSGDYVGYQWVAPWGTTGCQAGWHGVNFSLRVDGDPPVTTKTGGPSPGTYGTDQTISFDVNEAPPSAGVKGFCAQWDNATPPAGPCQFTSSGSVSFSGSNLSLYTPHTLYVIAYDNAVPTSNVSVTNLGTWTYSPDQYITASASAGGSISPSGTVGVAYGGGQTFTITANPCNHINDVAVDGSSVGAVGSYTFTNVQSYRSITASFAVNGPYTISPSSGANGGISPSSPVSVSCGDSRTLTITPANCYRVANVLVDNVSVGAVTSYTFNNVQGNHTIAASFAPTSGYTITASADAGGSISPSGPVAVNCGASKTFTIAPSACYVVSNVLVDGGSVGAVNSYTFNNVQSDHTISASFALNSQVLPPAPAGLSVVNLGTGKALHVSWNAVSSASSYMLRRVDGNNTVDLSVTGTQTDVTGLTRLTNYTFSVRAISGCGAGSFGGAVTHAPDWYPVLLVHGICGSSSDFTQCSLGGLGELTCPIPNPVLLGDALKSAGLTHVYAVSYQNNAGLATVAPAIAQRIKDILAATGESRLNIVAHSQGGLVSRYAIQILGMSPKVANLVMIGTPNHGSEWAKWMILAPALQPSWMRQIRTALGLDCLATGQAGYDLVSGSTFLNQLNYGNATYRYDALANPFNPFQICPSHYAENLPSATQSWLILGTGGWCNFPSALKGSVGLCEPNDGVVSIANGQLAGLGAFYSRRDDGLDPAPARHPRATHFGGSTQLRGHGAGCNLEELKHPTLISAAYLIVTSGSLPGAAPAQTVQAASDTIDQAKPVIQIADTSGTISAGATARDTVLVAGAQVVTFLQAANQGGLELAVTDPAGVRWSAADTVSGVLTYEGDPEAGLQALTFGTPATGRWVIESSNSSLTQDYSTAAFAQGDTLLNAEIVVVGQDSVRVRSAYFDPNGTLPGAQISALLQRPDSSSIAVALYDDGAHGDSLANDGIFGAKLSSGGLAGAYALRVDGMLEQTSQVLSHQQVLATTIVQPLSDLQIDSAAVVISRIAGSAESLSVSTTVRNLGLGAAHGALIQFEDPNGQVATATTDIDPLAAATVSIGWRPSRTDSSAILIYVDRGSPFLQSRYDNDSVLVVLDPSTVAVGVPRPPTAIWLATPAPNPIVSRAIIRFGIPRTSQITLKVYDVAGRTVATLLDGIKAPGTYGVPWSSQDGGRRISPGMYFIELRADGHQIVRRAALLR